MATRAEDLQSEGTGINFRNPWVIGVIVIAALIFMFIVGFYILRSVSGSSVPASSAFPVKSVKLSGPRYPGLATNTVIAGLAERRIIVDPTKPGAEITGDVLVSKDDGSKQREVVVVFSATYNGLQVSGHGIAVAEGRLTDGELVEVAAQKAVDGLKEQFAAQNVSFEKPKPTPDPNAQAPTQ